MVERFSRTRCPGNFEFLAAAGRKFGPARQGQAGRSRTGGPGEIRKERRAVPQPRFYKWFLNFRSYRNIFITTISWLFAATYASRWTRRWSGLGARRRTVEGYRERDRSRVKKARLRVRVTANKREREKKGQKGRRGIYLSAAA